MASDVFGTNAFQIQIALLLVAVMAAGAVLIDERVRRNARPAGEQWRLRAARIDRQECSRSRKNNRYADEKFNSHGMPGNDRLALIHPHCSYRPALRSRQEVAPLVRTICQVSPNNKV